MGSELKKLICTIIAQPAEGLEKQQVDLPIYHGLTRKISCMLLDILVIIFLVVCRRL